MLKPTQIFITMLFSMLFMYAGSGSGSARERRVRAPVRGTGSRRNSLALARDEDLPGSECAATFRIFIKQTWFGYCLTCLLTKDKATTPPSVII